MYNFVLGRFPEGQCIFLRVSSAVWGTFLYRIKHMITPECRKKHPAFRPKIDNIRADYGFSHGAAAWGLSLPPRRKRRETVRSVQTRWKRHFTLKYI